MDEAFEEARAFRELYGLRADLEWIRTIAADPGAVHAFGVPLSVEEQTVLQKRLVDSDRLADIVKAYAARQPEYAGVYTDQARGGLVVVQFTGRVQEHRAAISRFIHPEAPIEFVEVHWSESDLKALVDRVFEEREWLETVQAAFTGGSVDNKRNLAKIEISSQNPNAEAAIIEHFGGEGRMYVVSDGTGWFRLPLGTIVVRTVDGRGRPVVGMDLQPDADISLCCDVSSMGEASEAELELRATGYVIRVLDPATGRQVGERHVVVQPGDRSVLTIEIGH